MAIYPRNTLSNKESDAEARLWLEEAVKVENWQMEKKAVMFERALDKIVPMMIKEIRVLKERLEIREKDGLRD